MSTPPRKKFGVMVCMGMYFIQRNGHFGICERKSQCSGVSGYIGEKICGQLLANIFHQSFCQRTSSSRMTMNVPVHRAQSTVNYKLRNKIKSLAWPAQSPDINIIENMWLQLKNSLQRNIDAITSIDKLKAVVTTAWMKVRNSYIHWLYNSIPRCLWAVVTFVPL